MAGKETFEDLARRVSDCSSAPKSGDLDFFGRGKMSRKQMHSLTHTITNRTLLLLFSLIVFFCVVAAFEAAA